MARKYFLAVLLLLTAVSLSAVEGLFQINSVFQATSYPMFGSGGKDVIRVSSAGISLKTARGTGVQGVFDLAVLFPFRYQEKLYPANEFSNRNVSGMPLGLDAVIGMGYRFDLAPLDFVVSGGFHTNALFEGGDYLVAFGLAFDAQAHVRMTRTLTAQVGLKFALDFGGIQTFISGSNEFAGFPTSLGFYTGIGLVY
jgi:hypothetical protein